VHTMRTQSNSSNDIFLITGGSQGLGLEVVKKLLEFNRNVCVFSRRGIADSQITSDIQRAIASKCLLDYRGDVSSELDVLGLFQRLNEGNKRLVGVVHCAGVYGPFGRIEELDTQKWIEAININLIGTFNILKNSVREFKAHNIGNFVSLSGGGATSPMPRITGYAASKAGVVRLVESVAVDNIESNLTFNTVAPGLLKTQMLDEVLLADPEKVGRDFYDRMLIERQRGTNNIDPAVSLIVHLVTGQAPDVTGRLLSAVWDDWMEICNNKELLQNQDLYTLRRILPT
jgi:NAD(P)-dependent dehydrogenase (short-subunit alcohol dehydrogenase family)